jgi:hypothetical protein
LQNNFGEVLGRLIDGRILRERHFGRRMILEQFGKDFGVGGRAAGATLG